MQWFKARDEWFYRILDCIQCLDISSESVEADAFEIAMFMNGGINIEQIKNMPFDEFERMCIRVKDAAERRNRSLDG